MKLLFRLFWLIVTQSFHSRSDVVGPVSTTLRVYPNDLDIFLHVNNGVYLTYGDLGRTDLMLRSNSFHIIRKQGWYPVVANETISFKKSLTVGQRFTIDTSIVGWSEREIYMEQVFRRGNTIVATALIDARFLTRSGDRVSITQLMQLLRIERESPELPEHVQRWVESIKLAS